MRELLSELTSSLPFLIALVLIAVGLALLVVLVLLNRARDAAQYADLAAPEPTAGAPGETGDDGLPSLQVLDLRGSPSQSEMRGAMNKALRLLRDSMPGRRPRYQLPWILSLGQAAAGKTTLLANTALNAPFGEPDPESRACLWWLFDRAVVLDVAGDLALRLDGRSSDLPAWRTLLGQLKKARRRRPLDGLLLSLPVTQLLAYDPADTASLGALAHQAELLRSRLEEARQVLGFEIPVYTVVTQCDRLPGFADFVASLEAGETAQMLGWSVRTSPDLPFSDSWVDDAFESIVGALDRHQLRTVRAGTPIRDPQAFLALPAAVGALREGLRIFWNQIFAGGQIDESLPARGLYLTVGEGFESEGTDLHPPSPGYRSFAAARETGRHRPVHFVSDLVSQKLLFEWNLARPLRPVLRRERLKLLALQTCVAAALVLGPLSLWQGHASVSEEADSLRCDFLIPARGYLAAPTPAGRAGERQLRDNAITLLGSVQKVPDYTLRSPWLPTSWWNRLAPRVRSTALDAYGQVVFPALSQDLSNSLRRLAAVPSPVRQRTTVYELATLPELAELRATLTQLDDLTGRVSLYDEIASERCQPDQDALLAGFQRLVKGFDRTLVIVPPSAAESFYSNLLCDATAPRFPDDSDLNESLQNRVLRQADAATQRLFDDNVLIVDLDDLQGQLDDLARNVPPPAQVNRVYGDLVAIIEKTSADMKRPEVVKTAQTSLSLSQSLRELTDEIAGNRFLGPDLAQEITNRSKTAFQEFRQRLADYSTEATGPLLAQKDGQVQLQLSARILALEIALRALLQGYAQTPLTTVLLRPDPNQNYLVWNAQTLQQAVDLYTSYQAFMGQNFRDYPGFQQVVAQASRSAVEPNVLQLVAQAQSLPGLPSLVSRELRESHLQLQVDNLQLAAAPLKALLGALTPPASANGCAGSSGSPYCQLGLTLQAQRQTLLSQLDTLLAEQALYAAVPGSFRAWTGKSGDNLAWRAYAVKDAPGLNAYLTNQRRVIQTLASSYAGPILTAVPLGANVGGDSSPALRRWKLILADLEDYTNKVPDNALLTLETFLSGTLATTSAETCLAVPTPANTCFAASTSAALATNPCDFFLEIRNALLQRLRPQCAELNQQYGEAAYGRIAAAFQSQLAGRFPFSTGATSSGGDATPAGLEAFFAVYDADNAAVRLLLSAADAGGDSDSLAWPADTRARMKTFLDELQAVRTFFSTFLDRSKTAPAAAPAGTPAPATPRPPDVPAFGLQVSFRPLPGSEQGGNEIIARSLTAGSVSLASGAAPPAAPPLWLYGTPVQVVLRWAQDSLAEPTQVSQGVEEGELQVGKRIATFEARGPWALLQLMRYGTAANQAAGTIELEVPVIAATGLPGSDQRKPLPVPKPASPARIYLKIDLSRPDAGREPVTLPPFPSVAPAVPSATGSAH